MRTLIELYDTSPIRNVLATVMFRPQEMILICPPEVAEDPNQKRSLRDFFAYLNCPVKLTLIPVTLLDAGKTERVLREVLESHQDCAIDISGGTDAALFAAGVASGDTPVFTYSTRKDTFFEIKNAPFARSLPNTVHLDVRSCLMMAGGTLLPGREDNAGLAEMSDRIDRLFRVYSAFRPQWNRQISYIQKISSAEPGVLEAGGQLREKAGNKNVDADGEFFGALEEAGLILQLQHTDESVSFRFPDERVRFWLRDVGAVLELQVFRACRAAGCFDDVVLSAVVNWQSGKINRDSVTNEIDVMAVQGIQPVFISCKTSEVHTDALNELAILRDRFGGKFARAILVTSGVTGKTREPVRRRADKLGIELVEWEDMSLESLINRLRNQDG
jgi:hypothetical protein